MLALHNRTVATCNRANFLSRLTFLRKGAELSYDESVARRWSRGFGSGILCFPCLPARVCEHSVVLSFMNVVLSFMEGAV